MTAWYAHHITRKGKAFRDWLSANGAQVLEPTNEWELIRFKSDTGTSVVYKDKGDRLTFTGEAFKAWEALKSGQGWRAMPATKRKKSSTVIQSIRARDGNDCFYCLKPVSVEDESPEHLVSVTHGGPNHLSNLFLAHRDCNSRAGHLSALAKIRMHVEAHLKAVITTTKEIAA
jgi:hypothetical protein